MLAVPLTDFVPLQAPEAVQEVALVDDQVKVELSPLATILGFALNVIVGAAVPESTLTDVVWRVVPPAPVQVSTYCDVEFSAPVDWEPLVDTEPLQDPDAVHALAFVELQLNIAA